LGLQTQRLQKIESVTDIAPSLGLDASYPFPLERITIQSPTGLRAKRTWSSRAPPAPHCRQKSYQYLQSVQSYSKPGFLRFVLYDQKRRRIYLTNIDHVDAFDLQSKLLCSAIRSARRSSAKMQVCVA